MGEYFLDYAYDRHNALADFVDVRALLSISDISSRFLRW